MTEQNKEKIETPLKGHKQTKKILNPPFLSHGMQWKTVSWLNERLPEMLWAVVVIGNIEREVALEFFRYVAKYVELHQECVDITLTGISKLEKTARVGFIRHITEYSTDIKNILHILLLFPELPAFNDWKDNLPSSDSKDDWNKLAESVAKTSWHQSQEATDCRWVKVLCNIVGWKVKFSKGISGVENMVRWILEYPNYGDMRSVRPSIRSMEMPDFSEEGYVWAKSFWDVCYNTGCIPEESVSHRIKKQQEDLIAEMHNSQDYYYEETCKLRKELVYHYSRTSTTTAIDSRHEAIFGIILYSLSLFTEMIIYRTNFSITARLILRSLVELYITLNYLLKKEWDEPVIWDGYRSYWTGQIKLIYLKLQEMEKTLGSINSDVLDLISNEDAWVEFVPINLGHWDSGNLRQMAEDSWLKDIYDEFYNYTSGFVHGSWWAIRESIYQKCINPLHRHHRVPIFNMPTMPNVMNDVTEIINNMFSIIDKEYPGFDLRITPFVATEKSTETKKEDIP